MGNKFNLQTDSFWSGFLAVFFTYFAAGASFNKIADRLFIPQANKPFILFVYAILVFLVLYFALIKLSRHLGFVDFLQGEHVESKNTLYLSRLDHLRFVAASLVIIYHYYLEFFSLGAQTNNVFTAFVQQGHTGVALFMVLSGYLLATIGYGKQIKYADFIINRVFRIYPLYLFCIFVAVSAFRDKFSFLDVVGLLFPFLNNYAVERIPLFGQLWSVAVEFQFYLIFPFLMRFAAKLGVRYLIGIITIMLYIKAFLWIQYQSVVNVSYLTIIGRLDQFMVGILMAFLSKKVLAERKLKYNYLVYSLFALFVIMWWYGKKGGLFGLSASWVMIIWPTVEAMMWGGIVLTYCYTDFPINKSLDRFLARLGQLSFSMYCGHFLVIPVAKKLLASYIFVGQSIIWTTLQSLCFIIPGVILFSVFTYEFIEKPFLMLKRKYAYNVAETEKDDKAYAGLVSNSSDANFFKG